MRILLACAQFPPTKSGYAEVAGNLASEFIRAGHTVDLLTEGKGCDRFGPAAVLTSDGRSLIRAKPDVVQVVGPSPFFTEQVILQAAKLDVPTVYTVYAFAGLGTYRMGLTSALVDTIYSQTWYKIVLGRVTHVVSSTNDFVSTLPLSPARVTIIPTGVKDACIARGYVPGTPSDADRSEKLRILFVGQLRPYKGLATLLRALSLTLNSRTDLLLTIVGDGPDRQALERLAHTLGVGQIVKFEGAASDDALHREYLTSDVLVLPSTHGESFGIVVLEARLHGMRVIASDLVGVREVVRDVGGTLVTPGDAPALAQVLVQEKPLHHDSRALQSDIVAKYAWQRIASTYLSLYEGMLRRGS